MKNYSASYYQAIVPGSASSAEEVIPVVREFIQPQSVVDVGCGAGTWLAVWTEKGVKDYCGLDGSYAEPQLQIPREKFIAVNLEVPLQLNRKFDLVTSLEVAEHIRSAHAQIFISSLCSLGDVILFSAAIPGQGGVLHVNEQYPQYWAELFAKNGFTGYDCLRQQLWLNKKIDTCYRQNSFFFVRDAVKENYPVITVHSSTLLPLVHPDHFEKKEQVIDSYKKIISTPFHVGWHYLKTAGRFFTGKPTKSTW